MAMNKRRPSNRWRRLRPRKEDTETTRQYTLDDHRTLAKAPANGGGVIRPNTGDLHVPYNLEDMTEGKQTKSPPKIVLTIVIIALTFISIITYFVAHMPQKD
jgi:hypothetical protein